MTAAAPAESLAMTTDTLATTVESLGPVRDHEIQFHPRAIAYPAFWRLEKANRTTPGTFMGVLQTHIVPMRENEYLPHNVVVLVDRKTHEALEIVNLVDSNAQPFVRSQQQDPV